MLQLNNNNGGGKRLEDVLREIEKGRRRAVKEVEGGWKPSLECITESDELLEMEKVTGCNSVKRNFMHLPIRNGRYGTETGEVVYAI
ncbi:hypothetical protein Ancab_029888 [Ancistrocladus abbreviatus]